MIVWGHNWRSKIWCFVKPDDDLSSKRVVLNNNNTKSVDWKTNTANYQILLSIYSNENYIFGTVFSKIYLTKTRKWM